MSDNHYETPSAPLNPPLAISHIVRTLRAYLPVIALSLGAVMLGYLIVAATIYTLSPSETVTALRFRIDFKGADLGEYPNGTKFSSTEIITTPVLLKAYDSNNLGRFTTFADFSRSIFVLESNTAHEALSIEYQVRMADPKLMPVDRDRLQREYEMKLASLSKDQYSLNYQRPNGVHNVPEAVARKVLHDILREWAAFVSKEKHVLEYRVALISPIAVATTRFDNAADPIIATQILRSHALRVQSNIQSLRRIPSADLVRTKKDGLALADLGLRLDDLLRFQIDPLVEAVASSGLLENRALTIRFLETQTAHDQRQVDALRQRADAVREALSIYISGRRIGSVESLPASEAAGGRTSSTGETVMPQLSESFLERVVQMTSNTVDMNYRKGMADEYRQASLDAVPLQQALAYDKAILEVVRRSGSGTAISRENVDRQLNSTRNEIHQIVMHIHEIYAAVSRNMNPSTELLTLVGVPATRVERSAGGRLLVLYGILTMLAALPVIVILCLLHNRIREEEAAETEKEHSVSHDPESGTLVARPAP